MGAACSSAHDDVVTSYDSTFFRDERSPRCVHSSTEHTNVLMSRIRSCEDATSPLLRDAVVAAAPPSTWSPKHLPAGTPVVTAHKHSLNPLALCNSRMAVQPTHVSTEPQVTPSLPSAVFNHRSFPTKRYAPLQLPPSVHGDDMW